MLFFDDVFLMKLGLTGLTLPIIQNLMASIHSYKEFAIDRKGYTLSQEGVSSKEGR